MLRAAVSALPHPAVDRWRVAGVLICVPCAAVLAAAITRGGSPWAGLALAAAAAAAVTLGFSSWIAVLWLLAFGLLPFVDPVEVVGSIPVWVIGATLAICVMLAVRGVGAVMGEPAWPMRASPLLAALLALAVYTFLRCLGSSPRDVPSLAAGFLAFPVMALVAFVWCSQASALERGRAGLTILIAGVTLWALAYDAAAAGVCGPCHDWVVMIYDGPGLLGPASRIWTIGEGALLGIVIVCLAWTLERPTRLRVAVSAIGLSCVILQGSRGQWLAFLAGAVLLFGWKWRRSRAQTRALLIGVGVVAALAIVLSPVGVQLATGFEDFQAKAGTVGYRLDILRRTSESWNAFGSGFSLQVVGRYTSDLGLPNTLLTIGYTGAALQLAVLILAVARGLRSGTAAGVALAAVLTTVLAGRPSLPLLETGPSAVAYGLAVGFTAALPVPPRTPRA